MEYSVVKRQIGNLQFTFECEKIDGEYLDTKVCVGNHTLCWITYSEIDRFCNELYSTINKYRI
jgi:hypothetical protein